MKDRVEFSAKVCDRAALRAGGICRICCLPFGGKKIHFDHILPAALGGKATLANCQAICEPCHKEKTKVDVGGIRKADRQRRADNNIKRQSAPIGSRPKPEKAAPRFDRTPLPPRKLYEKIR